MNRISEVIIEGRVFYIVKGKQGFSGIAEKHAGNGKIAHDAKRLCTRKTYDECLNALEVRLRVEKMLESGMSELDAAMKIIVG